MTRGSFVLGVLALLTVWAAGVGTAWLMTVGQDPPKNSQTLHEAMLTGAAQSFAQVYEARCGVGMTKNGLYPRVGIGVIPEGYQFAYADEESWSITLDEGVALDPNAAVGVFVPHEVAHLAVWATFPRSLSIDPHDPAYFGAALEVITGGSALCPNPFTAPEE